MPASPPLRRFLLSITLLLAAVVMLAAGQVRAAVPVLSLAPDAQGQSLTPFLEVLEDPSAALTIAQVQEAAQAGRFRPVAGQGQDINFGYSASAYWLRATVRAGEGMAGEWLLEVGYASLDHVTLFVPGRQGVASWSSGDLMPFAARYYPHRNFVFPLALTAGEPQILYVRIQSAGSLTAPLTLWAPRAFQVHNQELYAALSLYYGMLLALGLYNLLLYFSLRERIYLVYVAFVAAMAVGQLSLNGLGNQFLWPDLPAWGNIALPSGFAATGLFGALFTRLFLRTRGRYPRIDRVLLVLAWSFAAAALAPLFLPYRPAAVFTSLVGVAFSAVAVAVAVYCLRSGNAGARWFLLAWTLLLVGVGALGLRNLGWLPTNLFTSNAMQIGSALEMLLFSFALADRIQLARQERVQAQAEALQAKHDMVEALEKSERELERRVVERTQDLADANARLQENERLLQRMAHQDPLTGVANRLLLDARLGQAVSQARRNGKQFAVLLIDLDRFKPVNDQYGHAVGDALLSAVATRLTALVRGSDTVARLGGDEFILLLEDVHYREDVERLASGVVASLSAPFEVEGLRLLVGASVGIAIYPEHGEDAQTLIQRADQAMYAAKNGGRSGYRVAEG
ncbi:hypothetical protein OTERR_29370 [Oryzomicrobium terrae]|uniref:GGDEF domain-containing protein n=1 Tax=Oryzomicrobium terrae TaxID=1735038 RepID=A0A5C1EBZ3_9RHOO|nr:hypothetical protein OTERR_29370 [Oryzomicrobium terrae]